MGNLLIAAALANAALPASPVAPALPDASPAIWVVNDHDTVIYLFGTFHALDGTTDWFNDEVATAFEASDQLVLETIIPRPVHLPRPPVHGKAVSGLGAAPSASFLASTVDMPPAGTGGMQAELGADEVLRRAAEQSGKSVQGLETFQSQLDMFARLPAPAAKSRVSGPAKAASGIGMPKVMEWMQIAWNKGDQRIFTNVIEQMRKTSPKTYEMMFTQRNANWAAWIARRMDQPGTVFVAVGAGHLAGIDSVQSKLSDLGVKSARIN